MSIIHSEATASIVSIFPVVKRVSWKLMTEEQREKKRGYRRAWLAARPGYAAAATKKSRLKDPEKTKAQAKAWRDANPEKMQKFKRAWEKKNPDKVKAQQKRHREYQKETIRKRNLRYMRANKYKTRAWGKKSYYKDITKSRAERRITGQNRKNSIKAGDGLSRGIVKTLMESQQHKCVYCPADLRETEYHLDHIKPLSKGGPHCDSNIQLTCASCNLSKFDRDHDEYLTWRDANK